MNGPRERRLTTQVVLQAHTTSNRSDERSISEHSSQSMSVSNQNKIGFAPKREESQRVHMKADNKLDGGVKNYKTHKPQLGNVKSSTMPTAGKLKVPLTGTKTMQIKETSNSPRDKNGLLRKPSLVSGSGSQTTDNNRLINAFQNKLKQEMNQIDNKNQNKSDIVKMRLAHQGGQAEQLRKQMQDQQDEINGLKSELLDTRNLLEEIRAQIANLPTLQRQEPVARQTSSGAKPSQELQQLNHDVRSLEGELEKQNEYLKSLIADQKR